MVKINRKSPSQSRSRETVNAILDAVILLLNKSDSTKITTNHIAESAGVSIGSLYQYFENKESIIEKILIKILEENLLQFKKSLKNIPEKDMNVRSLVTLLVQMQFDIWVKMGRVTTGLLHFAPKIIPMNHFHQADTVIVRFLMEQLEYYQLEIRPTNKEEAFFICVQSVRAVFFMSFVGTMAHKRDNIISELIDMIASYLEVKH